jgi:hypothetical protein
MEYNDYPALYKAADNASTSAQSAYLWLIKGHVFLLVVGAGLLVNSLPTKEYSLFNAFVFLCALGISIFLAVKKYEKTWYSARAVAESVKTATWRYMMKADPFLDAPTIKEVNSVFRNLLNEILRSNNQLGEVLGGAVSASDQLSAEMESTRASSLENRKSVYLKDRVDEQRKWYADKSGCNKCNGKRFFILLVVLQVVAIGLVLARIAYPQWTVWPTDVFIVMAGGVLTWIQVKRFQEIATAYALAAHEIGIVRGYLADSDTDEEFSRFVKDAENAFSREHTQWVVRQNS